MNGRTVLELGRGARVFVTPLTPAASTSQKRQIRPAHHFELVFTVDANSWLEQLKFPTDGSSGLI